MVLATCGVNLLAEPDGRIQPGILPVAQEQTPQAVVEAFLEAWNSEDFEAMYGLISPQSRDLYPLPVFQARYEQAHDTLNFTGVSYTLQQATIQGTSTALGYDVSVESAIFDPITDSGRTIRLVLSPEGWRIAWSTLDIFDTMAGEARLRIDSRFRPRASIFDRDGEVLVEDSGGMTILYAVQQDMLNEDQCIDLLAEVLRRSRASLVRQFANYAPETQFFVGVMDTELYEQYQIDLENTCRIFDDGSGFSKLLQTRTRR